MAEVPKALDRLLSAGVAAFPVNQDKTPRIQSWQKLATTDRAVAEKMPQGDYWAFHTGMSGLIVVDIDQHGVDGEESWTQFRTVMEIPEPPKGAIAHTPSGGRHLYFRVPEGAEQMQKKIGAMPGLDLITGNGYVIAWELAALKPETFPEAPAALIHMVMPSIYKADVVVDDIKQAEAYAKLTTAQKLVYSTHAEKEIARLLKQLDAAKDWPEGVRDEHGRGWEKLCADVAVLFHGMADDGWSGKTRDELRELYLQHAPTNWTPGPVVKWRQQAGRRHSDPIKPPSMLDVLAAAAFPDTANPPEKGEEILPRGMDRDHAQMEGTTEWCPGGRGWSDKAIAESALLFASRTHRWVEDIGSLAVKKSDLWALVDGRGAPTESLVSYSAARLNPGNEDGSEVEQAYAALTKRFASGTKCTPIYSAARRSWAEYSTARDIPGSVADVLTVNALELDIEPEVLWAGGVAWDLRQSYDIPVRAEQQAEVHLHSAMARLPVPDETPAWDNFLQVVLPDPEYREWALTVLAVALTGYSPKIMPYLWGPKDAGKTSILTMLGDILGTYFVTADKRMLTGQQAHASIIFALKGARLATIDETPRDTWTATEALKQLTGGGRLTGNAMKSNPITFSSTHTLTLTDNNEPKSADPALHTRIRPIHFATQAHLVAEARRLCSGPAWYREQPAVLAKMMTYAARYLDDPRKAGNSERDIAAMAELEVQGDPLAYWLHNNCTLYGEEWTPVDVLWGHYRDWCGAAGIEGRERGSVLSFGHGLRRVMRSKTHAPEREWTGRLRGGARTIRIFCDSPLGNLGTISYANLAKQSTTEGE